MIAGMSVAVAADKGTDAKSRADAVVAKYAKPAEPGCAVGVYQDGNVVYEGAYGLANLEHSVPIDPRRTVFEIGSVSKQFTAASILLLAQDGKLKLDDDIRKYLPEMPDYGHVITIDHLLHHTSGLRDYLDLRWITGKTEWNRYTEQETLDLIASQKGLNFTPGARYAYSNTGYVLSSVIVHRVSGKSLANFAQERIFTPLGMSNTYFETELGRVAPHHASGYSPAKDGTFEARSDRSLAYGDSNLQTTLPDLAKWQRNFDEPKVGGAWLIERLEQNAVLNSGEKIPYGRGLYVYGEGTGYRRLRMIEHSGGTWDGYRAVVMRFPKHKFSIALLCNSDNAEPYQLGNELIDIYLEGKFPDPPQASTSQDPEPKATGSLTLNDLPAGLLGIYWNREDIVTRRIELTDGRLWYVRSSESRSELVPVGNNQLRMIGVGAKTILELLPSKKGPLMLRVISASPVTLEKVEPFSNDDVPEYAGTYINRELGDARIVFTVKEGKLILLPPPEQMETLNPVFKDAFMNGNEDVLLVFRRNASGRVESLLVDTARLRNMVFTRVSKSQSK
jgi:CubicO group peptidase (beta-lactamase class C family)